jgi:hypothetical protein
VLPTYFFDAVIDVRVHVRGAACWIVHGLMPFSPSMAAREDALAAEAAGFAH